MGRRNSGSITLASAARICAVGSDIIPESSAATMRAGTAR
jgi:hypothetical protein